MGPNAIKNQLELCMQWTFVLLKQSSGNNFPSCENCMWHFPQSIFAIHGEKKFTPIF